MNTCTLLSHGALAQPRKPQCDAPSAPIAWAGTGQGPGRFGAAPWQTHQSLLGGGSLGLKEGPCRFDDALLRSVLFGPSKLEVK